MKYGLTNTKKNYLLDLAELGRVPSSAAGGDKQLVLTRQEKEVNMIDMIGGGATNRQCVS